MFEIPNTRPDERFFQSRVRPRCLYLTLYVIRLALWVPYPFLSLCIGRLWGQNCRALQLYLGIKADGSQSHAYHCFVMVTTPKELAAIRIHGVSRYPAWDDMGGF